VGFWGVTVEKINDLERQLIAAYVSKKKRKDIFRDFVSELFREARRQRGGHPEGVKASSSAGRTMKFVANIDKNASGRMYVNSGHVPKFSI
jgi:hypothetical protein